MSRTNFENFRVYKLAEELADEIWKIVHRWNTFARDTVGRQIVRCADSIGANIAEGTGRYNFQDNRRFVKTARGSLNETQHFPPARIQKKPSYARRRKENQAIGG
jgi:four helix bundle protein